MMMFGLTPVAACDSGSFAMSVSAVFAGQATPNTPATARVAWLSLNSGLGFMAALWDFPVS